MKKVLLASTALLLTAGFASAQSIELSGSASAGLQYDADAAEEVTVNNEVDFKITGSGATDTGLEFGAFIDIDESDIDGAEVFISGVFGKVTVGDIDPATDKFGIADIGYDGIGVDDAAEQFKKATGGADVHYFYAASGLTFMASAAWEGDDTYAVAVEYEAQGFSGGIGYITDGDGADLSDDGGPDATGVENNTWTIAAGYSQGPISVNGIYSDWSGVGTGGGEGYGVDVSYDTGAATITAAYSNASGVSAGGPLGDSYGVGFEVPLGGGLSVAGGVGSVQPDVAPGATTEGGARTVADLGLTMSF